MLLCRTFLSGGRQKQVGGVVTELKEKATSALCDVTVGQNRVFSLLFIMRTYETVEFIFVLLVSPSSSLVYRMLATKLLQWV